MSVCEKAFCRLENLMKMVTNFLEKTINYKRALIVARGELFGDLYQLIGDSRVGDAIVVNVVIESVIK